MPLLDLKTTLKDLKFGTVAPYIQKDINNPGIPSSNQVQARREDLQRLTKMLTDKPGIEFTAHQLALEASKADTFRDIFDVSTVLNPALRVGNMLAQIPVNRTGTHFLTIDGAALANFYASNMTAASEALAGKEVRVTRASRLKSKSSTLDRRLGVDTKSNTQASLEAESTGKVSLGVTPVLGDTKSTDKVNMLQPGSTTDENLLLGVTFNVYGKPDDTLLTFRGFVQNISDNYNANWQGVNYVRRMEQFFTYTGFTRTFSYQLVIPVFSDIEQPFIYNKINSLVSYTAPSYVNNLPQGTIVYMTMGNYLRTAGIINSVSITVSNEIPWSSSFPNAYGANTERILPQVITANIQFTPIHSTVPQLYTSPFGVNTANGPFINQSSDIVDTQRREVVPENPVDFPAVVPQRNTLENQFQALSNRLTSQLLTPRQTLNYTTYIDRLTKPKVKGVVEVGDVTNGQFLP